MGTVRRSAYKISQSLALVIVMVSMLKHLQNVHLDVYMLNMCQHLYERKFAIYNPSPKKYLQKLTLFHIMLNVQ